MNILELRIHNKSKRVRTKIIFEPFFDYCTNSVIFKLVPLPNVNYVTTCLILIYVYHFFYSKDRISRTSIIVFFSFNKFI